MSKTTVEDRARALVGKVTQDADHPSVFWVPSNSHPERKYRVQIITEGDEIYVTCTCAFGLHQGSSGDRMCSHVRAVMYLVTSDRAV